MTVTLMDAMTRFMAGWPGAVTAILAIGGVVVGWRWDVLRRKRLDASLAVLACLDRIREAFHSARRQDLASSAAPNQGTAAKWREAQMLAFEQESKRVLAALHQTRDGLLAAQGHAVALWGEEAKECLQPIYALVDRLTIDSQRYWPMAITRAKRMDSRGATMHISPQEEAAFPQPPQIVYGTPGDGDGRRFDEAVAAAMRWYEEKKTGWKLNRHEPAATG